MAATCTSTWQARRQTDTSLTLPDAVSDDYTARVWDWASGKCRHVLEGHGGWLSDVALVHNGSRAVTVSGDDLAVVWDLEVRGHQCLGRTAGVVFGIPC